MRVDVQTHCLPPGYIDHLRDSVESIRIEDRNGQTFVRHPVDSFPLFEGFTDVERRLAWMDEHDIDVGLLSVSKPDPNEPAFSVAESVELARALNDGYAALRDDYPDRFSGFASLPFRDPEAAVAELDRVANDLELAGVGLHTSVHGKPWSHPDFEPIFTRLDELGVNAFVHPVYNCLGDGLGDAEWMLNPMVVYPTDTTFEISRLIFEGFFDRYEFDVVLAHLGGAIPYLVGRLETARRIARERFEEGHSNVPDRPIDAYLAEFYYDVISHHPPALRCAIETVGADRLLFATDYPFEAEDCAGTLEDLRQLDLSEDEHSSIMGETASELFQF